MDCRNCKNELLSNNRYCPDCGGKIIRNRLTLKNLFASFSEQFFNYDNKFLQTFITLFKKPEAVIGSYIKGTRKKYVNVISYFAIAITVSGLQIYIIKKYGVDFDFYTNDNPIIAEQQRAANSKIFNFISDYQSLVMMFYIPIYALIAKLVFLKIKTFNYTELLVVFMYAQAQYSILSVIIAVISIPLGLPYTILGLILLPLQLGYFGYCLKRVYGLNAEQMIIRTLIFLGIMIVLMFIGSVIASIVMYQSGMFQEVIEAQQKARTG